MAKKTFDLTAVASAIPAKQRLAKIMEEENSRNSETNSKKIESENRNIGHAQNSISAQDEDKKSTLPDTPKIEKNSTEAILEARPLEVLNRVQTGYKQGTNRVQEQGTNGVQTEYKQGTDQVLNRVQTEYKQGTKQSTELEKTEYKQGTNGVQNWTYFKIKGNEKVLLDFVFKNCDQIGSKTSPPMTLEFLASVYGVPTIKNKNTAKVSLARLCDKGFLHRNPNSITGRGGYTVLDIPEHHFMTIKATVTGYKQSTNGVQTDTKQGTKQGTEQGTNALSSSSNDLLINNNTTTEPQIDIPEELEKRVKQKDILRFLKAGSTLEMIESSMLDLAFDLKNNCYSGNDPYKVFFGKLLSGQTYNSFKRLEVETRQIEEYNQKLKQQLDKREVLRNETLRKQFKLWFFENEDKALELLDLNFYKGRPISEIENHVFEQWKLKFV